MRVVEVRVIPFFYSFIAITVCEKFISVEQGLSVDAPSEGKFKSLQRALESNFMTEAIIFLEEKSTHILNKTLPIWRAIKITSNFSRENGGIDKYADVIFDSGAILVTGSELESTITLELSDIRIKFMGEGYLGNFIKISDPASLILKVSDEVSLEKNYHSVEIN